MTTTLPAAIGAADAPAPTYRTDVPVRRSAMRWAQRFGGHSAFPSMVLVAVAITWGAAFSVVDGATVLMDPADLVLWRFAVAGLVLTICGRRAARLPLELLRRGVVLGALLGGGFLLQTWALTDTDAIMSGFLIGTLVVMAPVLAWLLFKVRPSGPTWCGVALATAGLCVMSIRGAGIGRGEVLTVLAAAAWALHLVLLARWGRTGLALGLARVQVATVAAMALVSVGIEGAASGRGLLPRLPPDAGSWLAIGFLALPATAVAIIAVSWAQPRTTAARAAVALTLEPVASAVTAVALGASVDARVGVGGALLVAAMLLVELGDRFRGARRPLVASSLLRCRDQAVRTRVR